MTEAEQLAYDRGMIAGRRLSHLADKIGQDTKNLRECADKLPAGKHRDYLSMIADGLEKLSDGGQS